MTQMLNLTWSSLRMSNCGVQPLFFLPPAPTKSRFRISTHNLSRFDRYKAAFGMYIFPEPGFIES